MNGTPPTVATPRKPTRQRMAIAQMVADGVPMDRVAAAVGLLVLDVRRIYRELHPDVSPDPDTLLTPAQARGLIARHYRDPEALAWLAGQQLDRRHNGRLMRANDALAHTEDLDVEDQADEGRPGAAAR